MKTFTVEKLLDEPIIISTAFTEWRAVTHMDAFLDEFNACIEQCDEPVHYIADLTKWHPDLTDIIVAANKAARNANAILHHPKVLDFLLVTSMPVVELAGKGLSSHTFGQVNVAVFSTVDEALDRARSSRGVRAV